MCGIYVAPLAFCSRALFEKQYDVDIILIITQRHVKNLTIIQNMNTVQVLRKDVLMAYNMVPNMFLYDKSDGVANTIIKIVRGRHISA